MTLSAAELEAWLSRPRWARYLSHSDGDVALALELYGWNSQLAAAALADACHLEVALRNAYDRQLVRQYPNWAVDPETQLLTRTQGHGPAVNAQMTLNVRSHRALSDARRGLGASPSHGKVVANTSFGFWTKLTVKERTATFWTPMLRHAFTSSPTRGQVHERVERVNKFRNRLAHSEPVFSTSSGLHDRLRDVDELFTWVAPAAAAYVRVTSRVPSVIAQCPVPDLL